MLNLMNAKLFSLPDPTPKLFEFTNFWLVFTKNPEFRFLFGQYNCHYFQCFDYFHEPIDLFAAERTFRSFFCPEIYVFSIFQLIYLGLFRSRYCMELSSCIFYTRNSTLVMPNVVVSIFRKCISLLQDCTDNLHNVRSLPHHTGPNLIRHPRKQVHHRQWQGMGAHQAKAP